MGWQPIETAPKDGTAVIFYYPQGRWIDADDRVEADMAVMRWETRRGHGGHVSWMGYYSGMEPDGKATHWMPLPDPPDR